MLTSFALSRFIGTIGLTHSHAILNVGVGSLCLFLCDRLLCVLLDDGMRLACGAGAAHGYGVAATTVAKMKATRVIFIVSGPNEVSWMKERAKIAIC
jgi:hypothetical protein